MATYETADHVARIAGAEKSRDDREFLSEAQQRFQRCVEAETELRRLMKEDLTFYNGEQWNKTIERNREADSRPCLTINRLPQFVHQVTNTIRQQKPSPKVSPVDETGDVETADVLKGIMRHIERQSKADSVRSYAGFYAISVGRGFYRITTRYIDDRSFDQEIYIQRVKNPWTVYFDPSAQEPDYSDAEYCFIITDMTEDAFEAAYPGKPLSSAESYRSIGDGDPGWRFLDGVRVAEYFCKKRRRRTVAELYDGQVAYLDELPQGEFIQRTREVEEVYVHWSVIDGSQILEEKEWPGKLIPVIPVLGEEYDIDGKTQLVGMVRNAKDPQRMLNYWESAKTETIALAPRAPYLIAEGQTENHEKEWQQANIRNFPYLTYKPRSVGQELVPPPQRQVYEPPIQAITLAQSQAVDHLKSTTGVYDASLGNRSNETTGIAIKARQIQGDTGNYHFIDNLGVSITYEARVLVDLIPKIYDKPGRVARIIGEDGSEKKVTLNQEFDEGGIRKIYDLNAGRYDVVVDIGPSFATRKEESVQGMLGFAQVAPELVPRYADLFVQGQDWPLADEIADRVRPADIPPKTDTPIPPHAQQMISQLQQQNQMLQQGLQEATDMLKTQKLQLDTQERMQLRDIASKQSLLEQKLESDQLRDAAKNRTNVATTESKTDSQESIAQLNAEIKVATEAMKIAAKPKERPPLESFEE